MESFLSRLESNIESKFNQFNTTVVNLSSDVSSLQQNVAMVMKATATDPISRSSCSRNVPGQRPVPSSGFSSITSSRPFTAYCDRQSDDGGWIVFQRRRDGSVDFYRGWNEYRNGFGSVDGEFWLGLQTIHQLTSQPGKTFELRIDMVELSNGRKHVVKHSRFRVGPESDKYRLHVSGFSSPTSSSDRLTIHNEYQFTTKDQDNDYRSSANCAQSYRGAWWYHNCHHSNLNGVYSLNSDSGIRWHTNTMRFTEMKIRLSH